MNNNNNNNKITKQDHDHVEGSKLTCFWNDKLVSSSDLLCSVGWCKTPFPVPSSQVTGRRSQVTGHRSRVTGHRSQVIENLIKKLDT